MKQDKLNNMTQTNFELVFFSHIKDLSPAELSLFDLSESPFTRLEWVENFADSVACKLGTVVYLCLREAGESRALLPVIEQKRHGVNILSSFSNYYTPYLDIVCAPHTGTHYLQLILERGKSYFRKFDLLDIRPTTELQSDKLLPLLNRAGFTSEIYQCSSNWRELDIENNQQFMKKLSGSLRSTIRRKTKKLDQLNEFEIRQANDENITQLIDDYQTIYQHSWKIDEPYPEFITQLVMRCHQQGMARLFVMYHGSNPVAAQFWIVNRGIAYIYKLAYIPEYSKYSVGTILSAHIFQFVIEKDGVTTIDYLTGNDKYKQDWMSDCRKLYGICAYNKKTLVGWLYIAKKMLKDLKNTLLPGGSDDRSPAGD